MALDQDFIDHIQARAAAEGAAAVAEAKNATPPEQETAVDPPSQEGQQVDEQVAEPTEQPPEQTGDDAENSVADPAAEPESAATPTQQKKPAFDPQVVSIAKQFGFDDNVISGFSSGDDLMRALQMVGNAAHRIGSQLTAQQQQRSGDAQIPPQQQTEQPQQPQATQQPTTPPPPPAESPLDSIGKMLAELENDDYDDKVVATLKATRDAVSETAKRNATLESQLKEVTGFLSQMQEANRRTQANREIEAFEKSVDTLGHPDLFGSGNERTPEQQENLKKLFRSTYVVRAGLRAMNVNADIDPTTVKQAFGAAFTNHIEKKAVASKAASLKQQSNLRMGSGQRSTVPASSVPIKKDATPDEIANHPVFREFFEQRLKGG